MNPLLNFRAESCMGAPANSIFSRPITSTFSALHFRDHPFTCQYNKENKRLKGLKFHTISGCFQVTSWQ